MPMPESIVPREIKKVFEGRIFTVQVETLTLPRGGEMKAEVVRHPGSVVLIPLTEGGDIILVRQYRPAIGRWAWELPAGTLKDGEDPREAAVRECHEEIGMIPTTLERLGSFFPTPGYCDEEMVFYRLAGLREPTDEDEDAQPDEDEDIEAVAYTLDQVTQMIAANEIIDLKTIAGVALLRR
jgi:ADP-ribose pyrophosphatase